MNRTDDDSSGSRGIHIALRTTEPTRFGHGWISGVFGVALGFLGLGAVLCFHFPSLLTMPELRAWYPVPYVRALLHTVLVAAFLLGAISVCLRQNKALGLVAMAFTLIAALLGGSRVPITGELRNGPFLGFDWLLLNLILYSALYVPLERLFARRPEQPVFRRGWKTDLTYFFVNSLLVQLLTLLTLKPAAILFTWAVKPELQAWVASLPLLLQFAAVLVVADLTQYWVHRLFHTVPWLWRFHAVHHSAEVMDWLAGSRLHLVDAVVTRGLSYVPIFLLGFGDTALVAYAVFVTIQATFVHANVWWEFGPLQSLFVTPRFHHWHHSAEREAIDKNFAVHLPIFDRLFGTYYLPSGRWPDKYGLAGDNDVPPTFARQFFYPFRRTRQPRSNDRS